MLPIIFLCPVTYTALERYDANPNKIQWLNEFVKPYFNFLSPAFTEFLIIGSSVTVGLLSSSDAVSSVWIFLEQGVRSTEDDLGVRAVEPVSSWQCTWKGLPWGALTLFHCCGLPSFFVFWGILRKAADSAGSTAALRGHRLLTCLSLPGGAGAHWQPHLADRPARQVLGELRKLRPKACPPYVHFFTLSSFHFGVII